MRLLVDTRALIWLVEQNPRLPDVVIDAVLDSYTDVFFSTASLWEMSIKRGAGKLRFSDTDLAGSLAAAEFVELPIGRAHVFAVSDLPPHHHDPLDRLLVAQALVEQLTLVTMDRQLAAYNVPILWA